MNVLYVNHTGVVSGGEHSLLILLRSLPPVVTPLVACPGGRLATEVERIGLPTAPITGTAGSLRLHPLHTPRALAELSIAAAQVRRLARRHRADVVHANSIRSGIVLALARLGVPTVVHVRDCLPAGVLTSATMRLIAASATTIVANSDYTARSVRSAAPGAVPEVVYNPVDLEYWDPARISRADARARLSAELDAELEGRLLLGVVAQITPWKGQDTAIEALRLLVERGVDAHLLLIGSPKFVARATRYDNEGYVERLRAAIARADLEHRVSWLDEREDVPQLMRALDMLLAPSHEEPFGRTVIEAMALRVPVLATSVGGPSEILEDGVQGRLLPPVEPAAWAQAIREIAASPELAERMGSEGRRRVEALFTVQQHVEAMLSIYRASSSAEA
ncbi:MAG: glycosyltransferase family 4 protein [Actinobacteria bacterium]|nr:MAG: glycosyltransferase family 4 protein [Actinomycetota bacterium]